MSRRLLWNAAALAVVAFAWRLQTSPSRAPRPSVANSASFAEAPRALPAAEPAASVAFPDVASPGLSGAADADGIRWTAPDGSWAVGWGWASVEGIPAAQVALREEDGQWIAEHCPIEETFAPRPNGIEQILRVSERPSRLAVRIPVDASARSWTFDAEPRVTLSRGSQGDLLEVRGVAAYDANGRKLAATLGSEAHAILITVEDRLATYPVTIDPLITPPSWTADPTDLRNGEFGYSVAGAGDFNRDGFADIIVGSRNPEKVSVYFGSSQGPAATAGWTAESTSASDWYGSTVAGAGDVNGDGYADVVVGERGYSGGGRALLYLGASDGPTSAVAWTAVGTNGIRFGIALAAAGDINRDGKGDVLVGADMGGSNYGGAAYLYYGTSTGLVSTAAWSATSAPTQTSARFGASVASAGDVNGDGYPDVIVGAPGWNAEQQGEGRAFLYLGSANGLAPAASWTADPTNQPNANFGACVAGAGDINGDGYADVLVGAPFGGTSTIGLVYLYLGSPAGLGSSPAWFVGSPEPVDTRFGAVVASPGDLNGDGLRDVVVSAPDTNGGNSPRGGSIYVYLNSASGLSTIPSVAISPTGQAHTQFGFAMAGAGDTNGDGRPDLVVGAPDWSSALDCEGRAYVYFGTSTRTAVPWLISPVADARLGTATAALDWADCADRDGIASYDVEVDDSSDFAPPARWSATVAGSQAIAGPLPEGAFYWRVRARDVLGNLSDWSMSRRVYLDGTPPAVPQTVSPISDAVTTSTPMLNWTLPTDFTGTGGFDVQVAATSDFSTPIEWTVSAGGQTTFARTTAVGTGRHWWRARARDTWGWTSDWSAGASFVVDDAAPTAPGLLSPPDGSMVNSANVVFDWSDSADANGVPQYYIYVDDDPAFPNPVVWAASVPTSRAESAALPGSLLYWRVLAVDRAGNFSAWSATWSFTRSSGVPSAAASLVPSSGQAFTNPVVNLDWSDASDPDGIAGYQVEVSTDATFTAPPVWSASTMASQATTAPLPEAVLSWRVRARDSLGNLGPWATATFRVDATPPTAMALLSPADGALVLSNGLMLDWTDGTDNLDGLAYEVQVDTEPTFAPPLAWSVTSYPSYAYTSGFADGLYYWRARAKDAAGNVSAWTATRTFTVDGTPPPAPTLLAPASGAVVANAAPTLDWTDVADPTGVTYEVQVADNASMWAPLVASAGGLTASQWIAPWLGDNALRYWRVRSVDGRGLAGAWSAVSTFTVDRGRGFYVGFGSGGGGQIAACQDEAAGFAWRPIYTLADAAYNAASGETRPASGDLDGDGVPELVVGRGRTTSSAGFFAILDDTGTGYSVVRWIQLPFSAYNSANGETWPACGDIDGDGRDEIVVGLGTYTTQGGYFALYDDASTGYAFIGWRRVSWTRYNSANGETRPAVGDTTGDGKAEVFIGFGRYPSQGGRIARYTSGSVAFSSWGQFAYTAYNAANGETFPACGDVDGDGRDELCIGMGAYPAGGGYFQYQDDAVANYASLGLKRLPWTAYNNAVGETRPSIGPLAGGVGDETVIGLGTWTAAGGYVAVLQLSPGFALQTWKRLPAMSYNGANGATRPSVRR